MSISVLVCAYTEDRWDEIVAAIESVREQLHPALEIVLVVDHNEMLFKRALSAFSNVVVVENAEARGLSGARNTGVATCRGEVVAFLDDDAAAEPDWLEHLATHFAEADVVAVGGLVVAWWDHERPKWFPPEFDWVVGCSHLGMPKQAATVRNFVGANMAFRREVVTALGGFSSVLGRTGANTAGCEETELCIRAASWKGGSRLVYEPKAVVRHHVPRARGTWSYFLRRCYSEGRSKAVVSSLAGTTSGLSAERTYMSRTIPLGIAWSLRNALLGRPVDGLRAVAMIGGTSTTVVGYLQGRRRAAQRSKP